MNTIITQPKVSILIPVYNRRDYLVGCVQSALDQTFTDFEIIVSDNASTDGTWEICQEFASRDSRVKIFRNYKNLGPVRNWLACAERAEGEYSKILWSDDLISPEYLEKLVPYLENPDIGFVYSAANVFSATDEREALLYSCLDTGIYETSRFIEGVLLDKDFPKSPGCALFRTCDLKKNLLLQIPNRVGSDFSMHAIGNDMLLFLLTACEYCYFSVVNEPLSGFRLHEKSISFMATNEKLMLHYDLAKGYFVENYVSDRQLRKMVNSLFLAHFINLRAVAKEYGITSPDYFYPSPQAYGYSIWWLIEKVVSMSWRRYVRKAFHDDDLPRGTPGCLNNKQTGSLPWARVGRMTAPNPARIEGGRSFQGCLHRKMPRVTVIMAVYNGEKFLEQAIRSVLDQSFEDFEYIVVDGGSTDGSIDIIKRYEDRITHWISEPDSGIYDAWNKGVALASGEWIAFLGGDDAYYANALKDYAGFIDEHSGGQLDYISSCVDLVDTDMKKIEVLCEPWIWRKFRKRMKIAHVGSLHHKSLYERYGMYDTSYRISGDYEFLLRPGKGLKAGYLNSVTAMMRTNGVSHDMLATFRETKRAKVSTGKRNSVLCTIDNMIDIGKLFIKRKLLQRYFR